MEYEIRQPLSRRPSISFGCPGCGSPLVAGLYDAGSSDRCPHCSAVFVVPGREEAAKVIEQRVASSKNPVARGLGSASSGGDARGARGARDEGAVRTGERKDSDEHAGAPRGEPASSPLDDVAARISAALEGKHPSGKSGALARWRYMTELVLSKVLLFPRTGISGTEVRSLSAGSAERVARLHELRARSAYPFLRSLVRSITLVLGAAAFAMIVIIVINNGLYLLRGSSASTSFVSPSLRRVFMVIDMFLVLFLWIFTAFAVRLMYHGGNMVIDVPDLLLEGEGRGAGGGTNPKV